MYLDVLKLNTNNIEEEFNILNEVTSGTMSFPLADNSSYKPCIQGFGQFNVYEEILPFKDTAVILDIYDSKGRKIDQKRENMIINENTYINANFIKTAFAEEKSGYNHDDQPFGNIIAT